MEKEKTKTTVVAKTVTANVEKQNKKAPPLRNNRECGANNSKSPVKPMVSSNNKCSKNNVYPDLETPVMPFADLSKNSPTRKIMQILYYAARFSAHSKTNDAEFTVEDITNLLNESSSINIVKKDEAKSILWAMQHSGILTKLSNLKGKKEFTYRFAFRTYKP